MGLSFWKQVGNTLSIPRRLFKMITTMFYYVFRLYMWAAPASSTLVALGILLLIQPLACLLRFAWAAAAALILKDCDFVTKILPEDKTKWPGRVAWVTGASSGIGLSLVRHLAARGCYLILSSRKEEDLTAAREDAIAFARAVGVNRSEKDFLIISFDMKDRETFPNVVETARKWKGRIDFLFSNAGELRGMHSPVIITSVLPGYIKTNLCDRELYADNVSLSKGAHMTDDIKTGLSADRSAELILRGSSRGLREVWIGKNPDLFYMYCMYYVPDIANRVVDQGAPAYLRSIEHEIRERHYAQRRAAVLADKEKGNEDTQARVPSVTSESSDSAPVSRGHPGSQKEKDDGTNMRPGDAEAGVAEKPISSLIPASATTIASVAADAVGDVAVQLQESASMKLKDVTASVSKQKAQPHETAQLSQQGRQVPGTEAGQRKHDGEVVVPEDKRDGRHTKGHAGSTDKHRGAGDHPPLPDSKRAHETHQH